MLGRAFSRKKDDAKKNDDWLVKLERTDPNRALVQYAGAGKTAKVEALLLQGTDPDVLVLFDISVDTVADAALNAAAENGHLKTAEALLKAGANINIKVENDYTPVLSAALNGKAEMIAFLAEKGANLELREDMYGRTALQQAARLGHIAAVRALITAGAKRDARDNDGLRAQDMICDQAGMEAQKKLTVHKNILELFFQAEQNDKRIAAEKAAALKAEKEALKNAPVLQRGITPLRTVRFKGPK